MTNPDLMTYTQQQVDYRISIRYRERDGSVISVTIWHKAMALSKMKTLLRHIKANYEPKRIVLVNETKESNGL